MQFRKLGPTDILVSELCLGTMTMGWQNDERESHAILDRAFDAGINFIDTADIYSRWVPGNPGGVSEQMIGRWMQARGNRKDVIIATKVRGTMWDGVDGEGLGRKHILKACDDSLRRLQIDCIDLYQCHSPDENTPIEETVDALGDLVAAGKVRYLGVSNFPGELTQRANDYAHRTNRPKFISTQPHYNLIHRAKFEREALEQAKDAGLALIPYSPLEGGLLTGKYKKGSPLPVHSRHTDNGRAEDKMTPQVVSVLELLEATANARGETMTQTALAWLLTQEHMTSPIIGATSVRQLEDSLGAAGKRLTAEQYQALDEASRGL